MKLHILSRRLVIFLLCMIAWFSFYAETQAQTITKDTAQRSHLAVTVSESDGEAELNKAIDDLNRGRRSQARTDLYAVLALLQKSGNTALSAQAYYHIGIVEGDLNRVAEARQAFEASRSLSQEVNWLQCDSYAARGLADLEQKLGNITQARRLYQEALELSKQAKDLEGLANAQYALGELELLQGNDKAALVLMRYSLESAKKENYQQGIVNAWAGIGSVQLQIGSLSAAFKAYDTARELHERLRDRLGQADTKLGLGNIKRLQNKPNEARKYFEDANLLYLAEQFILGQGNAQLGLGRLDSALEGHAEAAREAFIKAISLYEAADNALGLANAHFDLAQLDFKEHQYESAGNNYTISLKHYQTKQDKVGQANVIKKLGDLRKAQEQNREIGKNSVSVNAANIAAETFHKQAKAKVRSNPILAIKLWAKADQEFRKSLKEKPNQPFGLTNWGIVLTNMAHESRKKNLSGSEALWTQALEKYDASLQLEPNFTPTIFEKGVTLHHYADAVAQANNHRATALWQQAITQYDQVLSKLEDTAKTDGASALAAPKNWSATFVSQANSQDEGVIRLSRFGAANNWGLVLLRQASLSVKDDISTRRDLLHQSYDKFALAIKIEPPGYEALSNWTSALILERNYLIRTEPEKAAKILRQARDSLLAVANQAPGYLRYNLACTYALDGMADEAVVWLKKAQLAGESIRQSDMLNESDMELIRKKPQFIAWFKSLKK